MPIQRQRIQPVDLETEMRHSYLDYSMSVIVNRALPDVRDGLKPVHRRILVAMKDLNLSPGRGFRKSAKITGDVTGNYHPHGTAAVYDTMVRMAQDFSLRYPLVDGQGNFGSIDGDAAAAERYTEARLTHISEEMLRDLDKQTVDFRPNYDETRQEPTVLPGLIPNLLINGASGIAVGMATNIPPHNLGEIVDAVVAVIDDPQVTVQKLMEYVPGPDFPTGGIICGRAGIRDCYETGRGGMVVRARGHVEAQKSGKEHIVFTEIPYQVNKAALLEKIADLVKAGKIDGIGDVRDESDKEGMRIVVELKREAQAKVVLNQLYKHTHLQTTFGGNLLVLVDQRPKLLGLRGLIDCFIDHRREVVERRTRFDLEQAEKRAHILEGLSVALDHIDEIIAIIKKAKDYQDALGNLMKGYKLTEVQGKAILDMRLQRLTGLERKKLKEEYLELIKKIALYKEILASPRKILDIIKTELLEVKQKYADGRRTEIIAGDGELDVEDLIADEEMVVTISHKGYIKRISLNTYRSQRRGGRGVAGTSLKDDDFIEHLFVASTHHYILFFTDRGRCYWLKVHEIPQGGRLARGRPIVNVLPFMPGETITAMVPVKEFSDELNLVMGTKRGIVKKSSLKAFSNPRRTGIIAIDLADDDVLIEAQLTDGTQDVMLTTRNGKAVRFHEKDVRRMGRTARGVKGATLEGQDEVMSMIVIRREAALLVVTEKGFGKRTRLSDFRVTRRGAKGIICFKNTERNGKLVAAKEVVPGDEVMIMTRKGVIIRVPVDGVSLMGRNAQGVKVIQPDPGDEVKDVARLLGEEANGEAAE